MKLLILDRDGVINQDTGDYVKSLDEWQPIPGSIEAMARLNQAGYTLVVATNQSGLARGLFDLDDLEAMHARLAELLEDGCKCRKPQTGMLDAMEAEFNISVADAIFVGDSLKDLQAAVAKDCRPCLVLTGLGRDTLDQLARLEDPEAGALADQVRTFEDLASLADHLLQTEVS